MSRNKGAERKDNEASSSAASRIQVETRPASAPGTPAWLWCARVALGVALIVGLYLSYVSLTGNGVAGCGAEGGCSEVLNSRWSKWLGIPVSLPAAALYLGLIALSFRLGPPGGAATPGLVESGLRIGSCLVIASALWFLALSIWVVGKFCPYCFTAHAGGTLGAILLLRGLAAREATGGSSVARRSWTSTAALALLPLAALIAGQLLFAPKTNRSSTVAAPTISPSSSSASRPRPEQPAAQPAPAPGPAASTTVVQIATPPTPTAPSNPVPTVAATEKPAEPASSVVSLYEGRFHLNVAELPLIGPPTATKFLISQFDYTCEHCRHTHAPIREVQARFASELAVISLPMPLDKRCNEWVQRTPPSQVSGCQLAALALGVWRADRTKFPAFDDWLMSSPQTRKVQDALDYAGQLVSADALNTAISDPWVGNTLQLSIALYRENWLSGKNSAMPMLMAGTQLVSGTMTADDLFGLVDHGLGLKR